MHHVRRKKITLSLLSEESLKMHYSGYSCTDIESFIINVIKGHDPMRKKRIEFYNRWLKPHGDSSINIINSILGI